MTVVMRGGSGPANQSGDTPSSNGQEPLGNSTSPVTASSHTGTGQGLSALQHSSSPTEANFPNDSSRHVVDDDTVEEITPVDDSMEAEPEFPLAELQRLDEMINRPRWVIPVLPKGELEVLLEASIDLVKNNLDTRSEPCQRFFREGLTVSFTKILTDEAVSGWKFDIHVS